MSSHLYQASVPVFLRYLERLRGLVDIAQAHALNHGLDPTELLAARLAPDMMPLEMQVQVAANFALRASYPLAGQTIPPYGDFPATFDGLRARIAYVTDLISSLQPTQFEKADLRVLHSRAGQADVELPAAEFLFQYTLPNFFFHVTAAYSILRSLGVAVGKADFDGFHSYP
jgi:hypothetical protein